MPILPRILFITSVKNLFLTILSLRSKSSALIAKQISLLSQTAEIMSFSLIFSRDAGLSAITPRTTISLPSIPISNPTPPNDLSSFSSASSLAAAS